MAKTLLIVESPSKAKTIGKYLGPNFIVRASMGHVRDLPRRTLGIDIPGGFKPDYEITAEKSKTVAALRKSVREADAVLLATDPDREGEAIAWHIAIATGVPRGQARRVIFHEITRGAVQAAVNAPRPLDMHLVDAQQARRVLDRLVGYTLSPVLWAKVGKGLSAGRVQSVALRLVVERERLIQSFVPVEYWTVDADLAKRPDDDPVGHFRARLVAIGKEKAELPNEERAQAVVRALDGAAYKVIAVRGKRTPRRPAAPFITSTLQQEASRKLGWGAKATMSVAQQLYEGVQVGAEGNVGLITYMRTDATTIAAEAQAEARAFIAKQWGDQFLPASPPRYAGKVQNAQEAHEAIRPTSTMRTPKSLRPHLSPQQDKLYTLIWRRFVASQMASAIVEQTTVDIATGRDGKRLPFLFQAQGSLITFPGFLEVYREGLDDNQRDALDDKTLPPLNETELLDLLALLPEQHFTEPPHRYTEATLVKALEAQGIGRPSTYAAILSTVMDRGYIEKDGKSLHPVELGCVVNDLLVANFPEVVDPGFTSRLEAQLDEIAAGKLRWGPVLADFYGPFEASVQRAAQLPSAPPVARAAGAAKFTPGGGRKAASKRPASGRTRKGAGTKAAASTGIACPSCKKGTLVERRAKNSERPFFGCSNYPSCRFTANERPVAV
ncbi:MAG TPA: type I DNA topoisomerase [Thermomicrobiales bacterium]|jgi:DNA topoisomerase-1